MFMPCSVCGVLKYGQGDEIEDAPITIDLKLLTHMCGYVGVMFNTPTKIWS